MINNIQIYKLRPELNEGDMPMIWASKFNKKVLRKDI